MNKALIFIAGMVFGAAFFAGGQKIFSKPEAADTGTADAAALKAAKQILATDNQRKADLDKRELDLKMKAAKLEIAQNAPAADDGSNPGAKAPGAAIADMTKAVIKQQMDMKLSALTTRLKLTPEQASALSDILDKQGEVAQELSAKMLSGKMTKDELQQAMKDQGGAADFDKQITDMLSPDQATAYQAYQTDEKKTAAETQANMELMQIQSSLNLTDAQKDKVFNVIYQQSAQQMGLDGSKPASSDIDAQLEAKKAAMQSVLTPEQYDNYVKFVDGQKNMINALTGGSSGGAGSGN